MESPAASPDPPEPPLRDLSISMERANVMAAVLLPVLVVVCIGPFWAIWGWDAVADAGAAVFLTWLIIPVLLLAIAVHEALHAVGFLLGGAERNALHFGIDRSTLSPFAGCRVPVSARAYRFAVLLPGLLLGVVPWAWGMATGAGWPVVFGTVMIIAAAGDGMILWIIRALPGRCRVLDHPTRVGCQVVEQGSGGGAGETGTRPAS